MIMQIFDIEDYWKVIVFYDVDYNLSGDVKDKMRRAGIEEGTIKGAFYMLESGKVKAATCSNLEKHISVVLFNEHDTVEDYVNSIVHEAEHVKQAMLEVYDVDDMGEPPAYTIGYLVSCMYRVFKSLLCDYRRA